MSESENNTTKAILIYLKAMGWMAWRQNQVAVKGRRFVGMLGLTDIIALEPNGPAWFIEVKNPCVPNTGKPGELSKDQLIFMTDVLKSGHQHLTVWGVEDFINEFEKWQRTKNQKRRHTDTQRKNDD